MLRTCDGKDLTLIRKVAPFINEYGMRVNWVMCDCGQTFDDLNHYVVYPHDEFETFS